METDRGQHALMKKHSSRYGDVHTHIIGVWRGMDGHKELRHARPMAREDSERF